MLIVDEVHNLEWDVLEEIRLLGNLENRGGKLLQIILAGQQEFDRKLDAIEYRQLKQRVGLRCALRNFTPQETEQYVAARMARAGISPQTVFTPAVLAEIHLRAQGIPRLLNALCDNLLLTAFALEERQITLAMVDEVSADMRLEWPSRTAGRAFRANSTA